MTHGLQLTNRVTDKHTTIEAPINEVAAAAAELRIFTNANPHRGNGETAAGTTVRWSSGDAAGLGWRELGGDSAPFFISPSFKAGKQTSAAAAQSLYGRGCRASAPGERKTFAGEILGHVISERCCSNSDGFVWPRF